MRTDDWLYSQVLDDFSDSMYDGGGEANRGGYGGGRGYKRPPPVYYKVIGEFVRQTEKAICIYYDGWETLTEREETRAEWFPKSQLKELKVDGNIATFECPEWLLDNKTDNFKRTQNKCEEIRDKTDEIIDVKVTEVKDAPAEIKRGSPIALGWMECKECSTDTFNVLEYKDRYHIQCANCGVFETLKKCE